ncbi:MAG: Zn-dependent exopeptidase M28 [Flavobacteriales bacterium]|nr:Zn-dependent exopeptidase M28 [Flavobacteriales bacterium]MCB9166887.1 Zn-dependent exopeptidase M28 [Flavobacteriales bacterium]MCB9170592.1 Zn-dependent exopeptidase M28 [Flavobacteriales bacterium]
MRTFTFLFLFVGASMRAQDAATILARGHAYIDTLASPSMQGRGPVAGGDSIAADYIAAQFARIGIHPVKETYFEPFEFRVNTFPDSIKVALDGVRLRPGIDLLVDPASGSSRGTFDLVHLTREDLLTPERRAMTMGVVTGRAIALDLPPTRDRDTLGLYESWLKDLAYSGPVLRRSNGKLTWSVAQDALPNAVLEVRDSVWNDTARTVTLDVRNALLVHHARNVLGRVKGRNSRKVIVLTAHYDHLGRMGPDVLFPGANDNASGVSMLLNLAEHFRAHPARYDLIFIAFAGEEAGLLGSEWCAVDRPFDLASIRLLINMDLMGTGDDGIMVVNAKDQHEVYDQLVAINETTHRLAAVKARGPACNSDHCPFVKRGVPGIFIYTLGGITAYHDVYDRPETLPLTDYADLYFTLVDLIDAIK